MINKTLFDLINEKLKRGSSKKIILKELQFHDWKEEEIRECFKEIEKNSPYRKIKILIKGIIIVVLILIIIIAILFLGWQQYRKNLIKNECLEKSITTEGAVDMSNYSYCTEHLKFTKFFNVKEKQYLEDYPIY